MINYSDMEQLVRFYQCGTLTEAAEQLHISKSALTRCMQRIEADIGVSLFTRTKNSIQLNEAGILAAKHAEMAMEQADEMYRRVRDFDRATRTILLGSCMPVPLQDLLNNLTMLYPNTTISMETKTVKQLLEGLNDGTYSLIILPYAPEDGAFGYKRICQETLMFCLPKNHRFAARESLRFSDMDGENMLLYHNVGFWQEVIDKMLPHSHFLRQTETYSLMELIENSVLPCFASDLTLGGIPSSRVTVKIDDEEAVATYYLVCRKENLSQFKGLFR